MVDDIYAQISQRISVNATLLPRIERFTANGSIVLKNFQKYTGARILKDLSKSIPGKSLNLMLHGHPSLGKTTELHNITSMLCGSKKFKETFFPMFSEFQRAESTLHQTMWENIHSGSLLSDIAPEHEISLDAFARTARHQNKTPLIILDTLDILLLDEVAGTKNTMDEWNKFLIEASNLGVPVVWTCRPYEWNYFKEKLPVKILKRTMDIELPPLDSSHCAPFTALPGDDEQRWKHWSKQLQSYMPLFASRWSVDAPKTMRLSNSFIEGLSKEIHAIWRNPLTTSALELPSTLYYHSLWTSISDAMVEKTTFKPHEVTELRTHFEQHITTLIKRSRSHRLRFLEADFTVSYNHNFVTTLDGITSEFVMNKSTELKRRAPELQKYRNELTEAIKGLANTSSIDSSSIFAKELEQFLPLRDTFLSEKALVEENLNTFFKICVEFGLLEQTGSWFKFTHQLLFEETLFSQTTQETTMYQFPSVALRKLKSGTGKALLRREAEKARVHWTGAAFSFHPGIGSAENADWNLWIEEAYKLGLLSDSEENEMNEKNIILRDYMDSEKKMALFLRGAPGTGKTYFCLNFIIEHLKSTTRKLLWRYVTMNKPLVDSVESQWNERESRPQNSGVIGMQQTGSGARSVEDIILGVLRESEDRDLHSVKLLDYSRFKSALKLWFDTKGQGTINPPSYTDAWSDLTSLFHHYSGARNTEIATVYDYEESERRAVIGTKAQREIFAKFCFYIFDSPWNIYSHAAFLARRQLIRNRGKSKQQYDMLMIDEVQDITPSTMALLLLLLKPGFSSKAILVAGDDLQTVNRSGFTWNEFCQNTLEILRWVGESAHPELDRIQSFVLPIDVEAQLQTLKQVYRNAPNIAVLNDTFRSTFADQYPTETMPNYPRNFLKISDMAEAKNSDCKISIISAPLDSHILDIIEALNTNAREISVTSKTSIITPYQSSFGDDLTSVGNFTTYDGETVKGLEFSGVVIFNPYEMLYSDAEGNLNKGLQKSNIEERIRQWMKRDSDASKAAINRFLRLYQNIMTRMNVLFSRPEYRLLIVTREPFPNTAIPEEALRIHSYLDEPASIIFSLPTLPLDTISTLDIDVFDMATDSGLDSFIVNALLRGENMEGYSINDYLRWVLDEAQIDNYSNQKQAWQNFLTVRPSELLKTPSSPIPVFSTLILSGTGFAEQDSFIGETEIRIPTVLTAFRKKFSKTSDWGDLSDQSPTGVAEVFLTTACKGIHNGELSIETYYALGDLLEPFLEYVLQDAKLCIEHYPFILHFIGKEILGIHFDEYALSSDKATYVDENLSFDVHFNPNFTKPDLEVSAARMNGKSIVLDAREHILDQILLHIYDVIDHSVFDHILSPDVFKLAPNTRKQIDTILTAPNHSPLWIEMYQKYPDLTRVITAPESITQLLLSSMKRQELRQTVQMLWSLTTDNEPTTPWPQETTLNSVFDFFTRSDDPFLLNYFSTNTDLSLISFFEDILLVQYNDFTSYDMDAPNSKLFNNSKFWSSVVHSTLQQIQNNPPLQFQTQGRQLWSTWFYNIQGNRPKPPQSPLFDWLSSLGQSLSTTSSIENARDLVFDLILFMNLSSIGIVTNTALMDELIVEFKRGSIFERSERASVAFGDVIKALIAGPHKHISADKNHVERGKATSIGQLIPTSSRDPSWKIPEKFLENDLHFLFQAVFTYTAPNDNGEKIRVEAYPLYNKLYETVSDFSPTIFSKLSEKKVEDLKRKRNYSKNFYELVNELGNEDNPLATRIPFTELKSAEVPWAKWLATLLFGALQHTFLLGGKHASLDAENGVFISNQGGKKVVEQLRPYFEDHFRKCSPAKFFEVFFSMVNCGFYNPPPFVKQLKPNDAIKTEGHLSNIQSHFNIKHRTAFMVSSMTRLVDAIESKPDGFERHRNMNPIEFHPVYRNKNRFGISRQDIETIISSKLSSTRLAQSMGLDENLIKRIRAPNNLVPFFYTSDKKSTNTDGTISVQELTNKKYAIGQRRMSAYDILYPVFTNSSDESIEITKKEWIIRNLDGLSEALVKAKGPKSGDLNRLIRHICYAMGNPYEHSSKRIPHTSMKDSPGRTLSVSILRHPHIPLNTRIEDHQLDWRVLFEIMKMDGEEKSTFDQFIDILTQELIEKNTDISFNEVMHEHPTLRKFLDILTNPLAYIFQNNNLFDVQDFNNIDRFYYTKKMLYFLPDPTHLGGGFTAAQKRYGNQVAWGFIRYVMHCSNLDANQSFDESIPIEERIFSRRD